MTHPPIPFLPPPPLSGLEDSDCKRQLALAARLLRGEGADVAANRAASEFVGKPLEVATALATVGTVMLR